MFQKISAAALAVFIAASAQGATVSTVFNYAKNNTSLSGGSALSFDKSTSFDAGIATVGFGAKASSGDVDASASAAVTATYDEAVSFADAGNVGVSLSLTSFSFGLDTLMGATAGATVDFDSFLGINPPRFTIIDEGYALTTAKTGSGLGVTIRDDAKEPITGVGVPPTPGISLEARVTLDASQESSFRINDLMGIVRATHAGTGTVVDRAFSI